MPLRNKGKAKSKVAPPKENLFEEAAFLMQTQADEKRFENERKEMKAKKLSRKSAKKVSEKPNAEPKKPNDLELKYYENSGELMIKNKEFHAMINSKGFVLTYTFPPPEDAVPGAKTMDEKNNTGSKKDRNAKKGSKMAVVSFKGARPRTNQGRGFAFRNKTLEGNPSAPKAGRRISREIRSDPEAFWEHPCAYCGEIHKKSDGIPHQMGRSGLTKSFEDLQEQIDRERWGENDDCSGISTPKNQENAASAEINNRARIPVTAGFWEVNDGPDKNLRGATGLENSSRDTQDKKKDSKDDCKFCSGEDRYEKYLASKMAYMGLRGSPSEVHEKQLDTGDITICDIVFGKKTGTRPKTRA